MTIVQISCPKCLTSTVVPITAVLLEVSAPETGEEHGALAVWICQDCRELVGLAVDRADLVNLASAGAWLLEGQAVLRPPHPEAPAAGPMWGYDDVLDLHLLLNRPDWFIELEALTQVSGVRP
jgi:hypothetical protein